jgi:diaminopimelate decarboxylase
MKWGFTPEAARPLLAALARVDGVELVGFSTHVGHLAIEPRAFALVARDFGRAVRELEQASGIVARLLDIGGGWPQHREPSAREFLVNRWTIDDYADAASAALRDALGPRGSLPELWLEPGRFIAGSAQLLLARVGAVKRDAGHVWIHVDASTNDLPRIESGRHWYHLLPASRMHAPLRERVEIVGGTCFRAVLGDDRAMPELRRDDLIAILDTGMYAEVFANQFNGLPRPATILVDETRASLIRHRESIADVFAHHRVPPHLAAQSPRHGDSDAVLRWAARGFDGAVA